MVIEENKAYIDFNVVKHTMQAVVKFDKEDITKLCKEKNYSYIDNGYLRISIGNSFCYASNNVIDIEIVTPEDFDNVMKFLTEINRLTRSNF